MKSEIKGILERFAPDELQKLALAQSAEELVKLAAEQGYTLAPEEGEIAFAALYPVRGKKPLDEEDLDVIVGGFRPPQTEMVKNIIARPKKGYW